MQELQVRFGLIAVQMGLLSEDQLAEATNLCNSRPDRSVAALLIEMGWISIADAERIRQILIDELLEEPDVDLEESSGESTVELIRNVAEAEAPYRKTSLLTVRENRMAAKQSNDDSFEVDAAAVTSNGTDGLAPTLAPDFHFHLGRLYSEGGLSRIWVAHDKKLNRNVALKQLRAELAGNVSARRRFRREAQITGQLEHPHIVPVYELSLPTGNGNDCCYAMRLIKGKTLRKACDEYHAGRSAGIERPLEMQRLLHAFVSVCQAISYANSRGVIHRDVKPENVVLGKYGEVVVLDWGLAKTICDPPDENEDSSDSGSSKIVISGEDATSRTAVGAILGTPAYMAPEQTKPEIGIIDKRTDVYGLGSTLFVLLTGTPPHRGSTVSATLREARLNPVRRPREINRFIPPQLDAICAKATAFYPADRYEDAAELATDVERFLADEPVSIFRDHILTKARRWIQRNRLMFFLAMAILPLITLGLLGWCLVLQQRLNESEISRRELEKPLSRRQYDDTETLATSRSTDN